MKYLKLTLLLLSLFAVSACLYKPNIQQGNVLDQKEVNKLRPGMTKEQVRFVLGNPVLNTNLDNNTWYYLYYLIPARGDKVEKRLTLTFVEDKLTTMEGTIKPETPEE